jgi:hypothetical protein
LDIPNELIKLLCKPGQQAGGAKRWEDVSITAGIRNPVLLAYRNVLVNGYALMLF